jgi:uncharacterized peroxidase-related enzyme
VTNALPISRFSVPDLANMPEDIRNRILAVQEKSGFIPNVFLVLAPAAGRVPGLFAYHDALMERPGSLTKAEREMIVVATSSSNQCQYCVVAHGAILRIRAKNPLISDQVAINYRKADITERQKAMLDFALKGLPLGRDRGRSGFRCAEVPWLRRGGHLGHRRDRRLLRAAPRPRPDAQDRIPRRKPFASRHCIRSLPEPTG